MRAELHPEISLDPVGHFYLHYRALLAHFLHKLHLLAQNNSDDERLTGIFQTYPFLTDYENLLVEFAERPLAEQDDWWAAQIATFEAQYAGHLPLRALRDSLGMSDEQIRVLLAVGMVEEEIRVGAVFATLQAPLEVRYPCLGILGWLVSDPVHPIADVWPLALPLVNNGLVRIQNTDESRAEWVLRVPAPICA